jgi:CHAD domain-containing protein
VAKAQPIPGLRADTPYARAAAATVRVRADELFAQADGVLDTERIERVHGMRVATRRLRAVLEIYAPCFPKDEGRAVLRDVKRLADALGARRDPDVQLEGLERFTASLTAEDRPGLEAFMDEIREEQRAGNETLSAALATLDRDGLRRRVDALVAAAEERAGAADAEAADGAAADADHAAAYPEAPTTGDGAGETA